MKLNQFIFFFILALTGKAQDSIPDFKWGNASYFNLSIGEQISFKGLKIKLLNIENHFNEFEIGKDTLWLKVSRRTLSKSLNTIQIFVADNKNVKALTPDKEVHGLLTKDALISVADYRDPLLNPTKFIFPVSFNDGFLWSGEEDSYMFSFQQPDPEKGRKSCFSNEGIDIDLQGARGIEKHWILSIENSTVVWIANKGTDKENNEACVMLRSNSQPAIFYVYDHLYNKNIIVKEGQKLMRGELIGTIWGDSSWGFLKIAVVKSDTIPAFENRFFNAVNFFPQLYELYFHQSFGSSKLFTKGLICFGKPEALNGNQKNNHAFEEYSGKGWVLGRWNTTDKVPSVTKNNEGNVRLSKKLYARTSAVCTNPTNRYDYEISVRNGVYRVRAKVGDLYLPSWQKIAFEGLKASTFSLAKGEQKWTSERVVKVTDSKLTIRIFVDEKTNKTAGLSEIVFQKAY